ncbi:Imm3 family immunity protein [Gorillibacterium sp. CAU 1737]|uniref:Imm3 family immunity protein n=1 Tax=Gorillibacterium sp. CAU 1737 TaxID=3140362 RepID=UPI0032609A54
MSDLYAELFESFHETYLGYKEKRMSSSESLERTMDDFELRMNRGGLEETVLLISYGEHALKQPYIFHKSKEYLVEQIRKMAFNQVEMHITPDQHRDLLKRKNDVLAEIEKKPVHFFPRTVWYYEELKDEVNRYLEVIFRSEMTADELTENVLHRFGRECRRSVGEKMAVYITLARRFVEKEATNTEPFLQIEREINLFNIEDVGDQFNNEEKQKLILDRERIRSLPKM